jgi:hypothetical protein
MKRTLPLLICLAHFFTPIAVISQPPVSESSRKQKGDSPAVDALWITVVPAFKDFGSDKRPPSSYFDLQSDGRFVFAEGDDYSSMKVVRSGILSQKLVRRAFQIVDKPSVWNAHDTDAGEPILSDSEWVSVGLMINGNVKARGGWGYQEEIKDFPAEFRKLISELRSIAAKLPQATNIKVLLSAALVQTKRVELIGEDHFIVVDEEQLDRLPALRQAIVMSRRMVVVQDEPQMNRFAEFARRMNRESAYRGLYRIQGHGFYELEAPYLYGAR